MDIFTYGQYRKLIEKMKKVNRIYTFKAIKDGTASGIILRHDIDFDIEKAYSFSKIEEEENIRSSYFVLTTSDAYNPCSLKNRQLLKKMNDAGFEIGLHFDPSIYEELNDEQLADKADTECSILENITGDKIETVSLHCPSLHKRYPVFKKYKNAYAEEFFSPEFYISDSCKDFRGKDIFKFIEKGKEHLIQAVLHPIHFSETETHYAGTFSNIIKNRIDTFDKSMRVNKTYSDEIRNRKLSCVLCDYINNCTDNKGDL